jgi:hypothetical protein
VTDQAATAAPYPLDGARPFTVLLEAREDEPDWRIAVDLFASTFGAADQSTLVVWVVDGSPAVLTELAARLEGSSADVEVVLEADGPGIAASLCAAVTAVAPCGTTVPSMAATAGRPAMPIDDRLWWRLAYHASGAEPPPAPPGLAVPDEPRRDARPRAATPAAAPTVSVLLPVYNGAAHLPETLASVLAQDLDGCEIVVSDNCSTDDTWSILNDLAHRDPRVRLTRTDQNIGCTPNVARVLALARGEVVKFVFADDLLLPGAVAALTARFEDERVVMASGPFRLIDEQGAPLPDWAESNLDLPAGVLLDGRGIAELFLRSRRNLLGNPSVPAMRRSAVPAEAPFTLGGETFDLLMDVVLYLNVLTQGAFVYEAEPVAAYRVLTHAPEELARRVTGASNEHLRLVRAARHAGLLTSPGAYEDALATTLRWTVGDAAVGRDGLAAAIQRGDRPTAMAVAGLLADLRASVDRALDALRARPA